MVMRLVPNGLSLLYFRRSVVSQSQPSLKFDWCVMHLSVCPNFVRVLHLRTMLRPTLHRTRQGVEIETAAWWHVCRIFGCIFCFWCVSEYHVSHLLSYGTLLVSQNSKKPCIFQNT